MTFHPENRWLAVLKGNSCAKVRLVCIHYAGGSVGVFRDWPQAIAQDVELVAIRLPGHVGRIHEPPVTEAHALAARLHEATADYLNEKPYCLFGYSMGATLVYLLALAMRQAAERSPAHLIVAARRAPHLPRMTEMISSLPASEFTSRVKSYEGTPEDVFQEGQLLKVLLPIWRADFAVAESYQHRPGRLLDCAVTAIGARQDEHTPEDDIRAWAQATTGRFACHMLDGGHFFINDPRGRAALLEHLNAILWTVAAEIAEC